MAWKRIMVKNILIFIFLVIAVVVIMNFSDHNFKRAVQACMAGSQLDKKVTFNNAEEAKEFCEEKIRNKGK